MIDKSENTNSKKNLELGPRTIPAQKRATETVERILDTAALLLDEVGLDGFNTNLLAERAEMRIATVYRYFPNKLAILSALVQRWLDILREGLVGFADLADPAKDWRETLNTLVDTYVTLAREHVGFMAIRRALQAAPELRAIELDFIEELSLLTVEAMQARGVQTKKSQLLNFGQTYMVAASSAADLAWIRGQKIKTFDAEIIVEVKLMSISYFANYLD